MPSLCAASTLTAVRATQLASHVTTHALYCSMYEPRPLLQVVLLWHTHFHRH